MGKAPELGLEAPLEGPGDDTEIQWTPQDPKYVSGGGVPKKQISGEEVLWVGSSLILLNEGFAQTLPQIPSSPLWPGLPSLLGRARWTGVPAWYGIITHFTYESVFPSVK